MLNVKQITSDPQQKQIAILPDGTFFTMTIEFKPMQFGWFLTSFTYLNFTINGLRICVSPNMLYQFKNQIPFGLACFTTDGNEPTQQEDFSSGYAQMFILTKAESLKLSELLSE